MADFSDQSRIRSKSVPNITNNTQEEDDIMEQPLKAPPPLKIDSSVLKNEILTNGIQVSAVG